MEDVPTGPVAERRQPAELDEFLARAVDRQIAEQRALRETLQALSDAVRELQAKPAAPPVADNIEEQIRTVLQSNSDTITSELRALRSAIVPPLERAIEASHGVRAVERDVGLLRDGIAGLSADVDGIAQALIDLNGGLRDWADGVDHNMDVVRQAVEQVRDVAARAEEIRAEEMRSEGVRSENLALPIIDDAAVRGDYIEVDETGVIPQHETAIAFPRDVSSEIEQRIKETIELSLYLADQIEGFDKAIGSLGDLPKRLEGVISQALKRTLAARAKLDREATTALDEILATLDEHVDRVGDFSETVKDMNALATGQAELASGLEAIAESIDRSSEGRKPRAAASVAKSSKDVRAKGTRKAAPKRKKKPAAASSRSSIRKPTPRKGVVRKPVSRKSPQTDYLEIDSD